MISVKNKCIKCIYTFELLSNKNKKKIVTFFKSSLYFLVKCFSHCIWYAIFTSAGSNIWISKIYICMLKIYRPESLPKIWSNDQTSDFWRTFCNSSHNRYVTLWVVWILQEFILLTVGQSNGYYFKIHFYSKFFFRQDINLKCDT